jgi:hypothetical protein
MACADDAESREDIVRLAWRKAEAQAGLIFDRVVSVGDAAWDVHTARSLGLPFVGVATGVLADRLRASGATTIVPDFSDAAAVLAALGSAASPVAVTPGSSQFSRLSQPDDDDDRVITTTIEDVRLYERPVLHVLLDNVWVLLIILGFLAMAVYGILVTVG